MIGLFFIIILEKQLYFFQNKTQSAIADCVLLINLSYSASVLTTQGLLGAPAK